MTPNEIYTKKAILQTRKKNCIQKSNNSSALNQKQQDAKKIKKAGTSIKDQMQIDKELARELSATMNTCCVFFITGASNH